MLLFVTGATGFVGSHFVRQAVARGDSIRAVRRSGSLPRLPLPEAVDWIDAPLDADFSSHFDGVECVVHLASHTPNPPYAPLDECLYWNVYASERLCQAAAVAGVRKFLIAGSCFEYGAAAAAQEYVRPDCALQPAVSYPISKAAASVALLGFARERNVCLQLLRIFQVYGEGEAATRFWPSLKRAALAGEDFPMTAGQQVRDFIDVVDVAAAFVRALDFAGVEPGKPHIRNVGTGKGRTLLTFAQEWWAKWNATGVLKPGAVASRPGEVARLVANVQDVHIA
jgi:nucleoside-diphosphate-sugar epimerase